MKKIEIFLLVAVCALSFVCYQQHKKINNMEWDIASLESDVDTLEEKIKDLESTIEDMGFSISSLQEEMEEHFPQQHKSLKEYRQEYIERIKRFNAAREEEQALGIKNTNPKVELERKYLQATKQTYNIDIEIK